VTAAADGAQPVAESAPAGAGVAVPEALRRALDALAAAEGRSLSSRFETALRVERLDCAGVSLPTLAAGLAADERVVVFLDPAGGLVGMLHLPRPCFFAWLALELGAPADAPAGATPERPLTRIEERFLLGRARSLWRLLERSLGAEGIACAPLAGSADRAEADGVAASGRGGDAGLVTDAVGLRRLVAPPLWWARWAVRGIAGTPWFGVALPRSSSAGVGAPGEPSGAP